MPTWPAPSNNRVQAAVGKVSRWLWPRRAPAHNGEDIGVTDASASTPPSGTPETVVILTTWNRPALLRQSLPQIERETASIGAQLVIADDQSDDLETLALVEGAGRRGASVIRREYARQRQPDVDVFPHNSPEFAWDHMQQVQDDAEQRGGHAPTARARETIRCASCPCSGRTRYRRLTSTRNTITSSPSGTSSPPIRRLTGL